MKFSDYFTMQIEKHPSLQPQDIVKLCYQAAFGAEHLLTDPNAARNNFYKEYETVSAAKEPLFEEISEEICRISLPAWKASAMPADWLFRIFLNSAKVTKTNGTDIFLQHLKTAELILKNINVTFSPEEWETYLAQYKKDGIRAVHHSPKYRKQEHPSYRIIHKKYLRLLPILQAAAAIPINTSIKVIAIDGRAASGKTTLAEDLKSILQADVIHMDDFFLPPSLRNDIRLAEPGGNVHYERFAEEVLPFLRNSADFSYRIFDCSRMDYNGIRTITSKQWRIVEGSYSHHPIFGNYADLALFLDVSPQEQMNRILKRNGEQMAEVFRTRWIPMEEAYHQHFNIKEQADIIL